MMHKEKMIRLSFAVLTSSEDKIICMWQLSTLPLPYQCFQTHVETFFHTDLIMEKNHSPLLQAHTRTVVHRSRSCSFLQIAGQELAPDKVDELGLCAEHRNQGCCKAQGTRADVDQPGQPALVTAEPHLQQRKQGIAGKQSAQSAFTVTTRNEVQRLCPTRQRHHQAKHSCALTLQ